MLLLFWLCVFNVSFGQIAVVAVKLHPVGGFNVTSKEVTGFVEKKGDTVNGKNIAVGLKNVTTEISLRDTHVKKYLEVEKYPQAVLVSASGKAGVGKGKIRIRGIEKQIAGTYKIDGAKLIAEFPLKLSDFKIENIRYMGAGVDDLVRLTVTVPVKMK